MTRNRTCASLLFGFSLLFLALLLSHAYGDQAAGQRSKALSEQDVANLLAGEVPPLRIVELVERLGINFVLTSDSERRLRQAGASDDLVEAIRKRSVASPEAWEHYQQGQKLFQEGDLDGALREFDAASKLSPLWAQVQMNRGITLDSAGNFADAALAWRRYLELAPSAPDATQVQDRIQTKIKGLYARSLEAFNARRFGEPETDNVFCWVRELRRVEPDHAGAREMETRAMAAYENEAKMAVAAQQFDRARQIYQRLATLFPDNSSFPAEITRLEKQNQAAALLARADQAFRAGNLATPAGENAIEISKEILRIDPSNTTALDLTTRATATYENQARQAAASGNTQNAVAMFNRLAELFPANSSYRLEVENLQSYSFSAVHYHTMAKQGGGFLTPPKFLHQGCWGTVKLTPHGFQFSALGANDGQTHAFNLARQQLSITVNELKYPGRLDDDFRGSGLHLTHKFTVASLGDFDVPAQGYEGLQSYTSRIWGWEWKSTTTQKGKKK